MNRRHLSLAAAALACLFALSACGTGFGAQTNQQYQAGIGADLRTGPVQVLGAVLVTDDDGSAVVSATVINTTDEQLELAALTVTGPDGADVPVASTRDLKILLPGQAIRLGAEGAPVFRLTGVEPGRYYDLTLTVNDAGVVGVSVPSVIRDAIYDDVVGPDSAESDADESVDE